MRSDEAEQILLRHAPIRDWTLSALISISCLIIACILFWLLMKLLGDADNGELNVLLFGAVAASFAASLYFGSLVVASAISEVRIDSANQWVDITRYRIYGKRTDRYHFHQIEKFRSYKSKAFLSSTPTRYSLELILINKKKVRIRVTIGTAQIETTRFIKSLNKTLRQSKATPRDLLKIS